MQVRGQIVELEERIGNKDTHIKFLESSLGDREVELAKLSEKLKGQEQIIQNFQWYSNVAILISWIAAASLSIGASMLVAKAFGFAGVIFIVVGFILEILSTYAKSGRRINFVSTPTS